jgi:chromosome segregation ATPase
MTADGGQENALGLATRRLQAAVAALEQRLARRQGGGAAAEAERARLEADLETARARERDLETAGAQASEALTRAIADIRAALGQGAG